jgi:hypothetical protein
MTAVDVHAFAREWVDAWNAHDLERVLAHYAEDVELVSPRAAQVVPESGGVIRGKAALRAYWTKAMGSVPDLRFELDDVFTSVSGATILYRNQRGQRVSETFLWNADGRVVRTIIAHAAATATVTAGGVLYSMIARVPVAGIDAFARYEAAVLPLLSDHGVILERRLRTADGTTEIHIVRFPDEAALAAYRADPRRAAAQPELVASGAAIELLAMR